MRRTSFAACAAFLLAGCSESTPFTEPVDATPRLAASEEQDRPVYIVTFSDGVADVPALARQLAASHGSSPIFTYTRALRGFAAPLSEQAAAALMRNPNVSFVELDQPVTADATQNNATWGLDRIDQRDRPLSSTYTYGANGAGVDAYILDTGIRPDHQDFGSRVVSGYTAISDGRGTSDCNGHGTHVAGTVGGNTYGVAKGVTLVAVRVLNCRGSGTMSGVIAGVDWVALNASAPAVANMSLGGSISSSLDVAVANAVAQGVTFVVAAGNSGANACDYSPARAASAITVGATTSSDARASYSNYGSCLDIFAPGSAITSAWHTGATATNTISGTSMASPHVAGVAALVLQGAPGSSPAAVTQALTSNASINKVSSVGTGSPNLLLYMGFTGGTTEPAPNVRPIASFTASCTNLTCAFNASGSSDSDGTIASYAWSFGDGGSGSGVTASRSYAAAGNYTVTLTVTDNQGATHSTSQGVSATNPSTITIALTATSSRKGQNRFVSLEWTGASSNVSVLRDGENIATVNGTTYQENVGKSAGSATYQVCSGGTCSNAVLVNY